MNGWNQVNVKGGMCRVSCSYDSNLSNIESSSEIEILRDIKDLVSVWFNADTKSGLELEICSGRIGKLPKHFHLLDFISWKFVQEESPKWSSFTWFQSRAQPASVCIFMMVNILISHPTKDRFWGEVIKTHCLFLCMEKRSSGDIELEKFRQSNGSQIAFWRFHCLHRNLIIPAFVLFTVLCTAALDLSRAIWIADRS